MWVDVILWVLAGFLCVATLAPLNKTPHGAIRSFAFLRLQFFWIAVASAGLCLWRSGSSPVLVSLFAAVAVAQLLYVVKFTPFWKRQSHTATPDLVADSARHVSLMAANVKMSNRAYDRLIDLIRVQSCDVVMTMEVDAGWVDALHDGLHTDYAHWVRVPLDNTYGLCVMSRLQLSDVEVREMITDKVPSIRAVVTLPMGEKFRLYVVHPEPPVVSHDTKGRDGEIGQIGIEARDDPLPCVVSGDLNDVAWSGSTRRFQRLSGLLDPRVGRGFYNTFHASFPMFRWPLDHLFHDPRFRLIRMERLPKIGSDHFPMLFELALADDAVETPSATRHDPAEKKHMQALIKEETKRDRTAIGTDWED